MVLIWRKMGSLRPTQPTSKPQRDGGRRRIDPRVMSRLVEEKSIK